MKENKQKLTDYIQLSVVGQVALVANVAAALLAAFACCATCLFIVAVLLLGRWWKPWLIRRRGCCVLLGLLFASGLAQAHLQSGKFGLHSRGEEVVLESCLIHGQAAQLDVSRVLSPLLWWRQVKPMPY